MSPIGIVLALIAAVIAAGRAIAAEYDEIAHAPATEAITHTLHPRHAYTRTHASSSPDALPDTLRRHDIQPSMTAVRGRIAACRDKYPGRGRIAVRVAVAPDGTVERAAVDPPSGDAPFDACIAAAVALARFPRSEKGVRFRYPFVGCHRIPMRARHRTPPARASAEADAEWLSD